MRALTRVAHRHDEDLLLAHALDAIAMGHHLQHWIDGGETNPDNLTLLCTHHHRLLHEGTFRIVKEGSHSLRFVTADGRTIPRNGYRLEDFLDDDVGSHTHEALDDAPRGGFCTATVQREWERAEVRALAAVYRIRAG